MKTTLARTQNTQLVLPHATASIGGRVFVSCEAVQFENGVLRRSRLNYAIPKCALTFFGAEVRAEEWATGEPN